MMIDFWFSELITDRVFDSYEELVACLIVRGFDWKLAHIDAAMIDPDTGDWLTDN